LRQTEVEDLQPPVTGQTQVSRLQIAVDEPFGVRRLEPIGQLHPEAENFVFGQRTLGKSGAECHSGNQLHHQKIQILLLDEFVNRSNIGVIELGQGERLLPKSPARGSLWCGNDGKHLQGDIAIQVIVMCSIYNAHAAGADVFDYPIVGKCERGHTKRAGWLNYRSRAFCRMIGNEFCLGRCLPRKKCSGERVQERENSCNIVGAEEVTSAQDYESTWTSPTFQ